MKSCQMLILIVATINTMNSSTPQYIATQSLLMFLFRIINLSTINSENRNMHVNMNVQAITLMSDADNNTIVQYE